MKFTLRRVKLGFMQFTTLIGVESLQELLGGPHLVLVDCRFDLMDPAAGRRAYATGHIPGARYADLNRDLSAPVGALTGRHPLPDPQAFAGWLGSIGIDNDSQVIAYDEGNGSIAARLWWMLRWVGHEAVAVLDGGFKAWNAGGGALQTQPANPEPRYFSPRVRADAVLNAADVNALLLSARGLLIDARAQERFAGEIEPIDPVAGHIPGAVNHPFSQNLAADGHFLPAGELKHRWLERLAGKDPKNLAAMCGSGVTACHDLLSLEIAGLSGGKLYAGSWSEWIRDPRRPTARG